MPYRHGEPNSSTAHISIRRIFVTPKIGPRVSGPVSTTCPVHTMIPAPCLLYLIRLKRTSERDLDLHHYHTSNCTYMYHTS